jgi:translation initiation factor 2 alpha subunit (eIF-2alpha)
MRYYTNTYPELDDIVICRVRKIENNAIYVNLLEYDNIEGMVQLANASTRRKKRSICLLKENKQYPLLVIAVDADKGYIDLSNKYLADEDKNNADNKYQIYQKVIKILNNFLYKRFGKDYSTDQYIEYAEKTIWKLENSKCYDFVIDSYFNETELNFDLTESENTLFLETLKSFCGEFQILSKLNFILRNPNYKGVEIIKSVFNQINTTYNIETIIDDVPSYHLDLLGNNKTSNENCLEIINQFLLNESKKYNMIYSKKEIISNIQKI